MDSSDPAAEGALKVMEAVAAPPAVNPAYRRKARPRPSPDDLAERIIAGDRDALSTGITWVESSRLEDAADAGRLLDLTLPHSGRVDRVGITGVPGVGKSTLIEALGLWLIETKGLRPAVLAIDPSSTATGGSLLGDKSRMPKLASHPDAFIRPSPTAGSLGGVAQKTREAMQLCEAAGFGPILVETVGVGQSETAVHQMVDCFLLLLLAGAGDELQGIKRGVMELADVLAVTKADGPNLGAARLARVQAKNALMMTSVPASGVRPEVHLCSALEKSGLDLVWNGVTEFIARMDRTGRRDARRAAQATAWLREIVHREVLAEFRRDPVRREAWQEAESLVRQGRMTPRRAAARILGAGQ
ncbi:MAG: methylmalonyl Co-A mutase-associated GTPase MeaB [Fimbriimonadaceae bacterium]|nr:methylmalonyl Co-A mutase-associated GTPase MeaB [Fimbriimonadaceae bacterium]